MSSKYSGGPGAAGTATGHPPLGGLTPALGQLLHRPAPGPPRCSRAGRGVMNHRAPRKRFYPASRAAPGACQVRAGAGSHSRCLRGEVFGSARPVRSPACSPMPEFPPPLPGAVGAVATTQSPPDSRNGAGFESEASPLEGA